MPGGSPISGMAMVVLVCRSSDYAHLMSRENMNLVWRKLSGHRPENTVPGVWEQIEKAIDQVALENNWTKKF